MTRSFAPADRFSHLRRSGSGRCLAACGVQCSNCDGTRMCECLCRRWQRPSLARSPSAAFPVSLLHGLPTWTAHRCTVPVPDPDLNPHTPRVAQPRRVLDVHVAVLQVLRVAHVERLAPHLGATTWPLEGFAAWTACTGSSSRANTNAVWDFVAAVDRLQWCTKALSTGV